MNLIDALDAPAPEGRGLLIIPKWDEGDSRIEWDPEKKEQADAAREHFVKLKAQGYKAYRVDPKNGEKGELLKEFEPKAGKIVMLPAFAGG
jgi:hypothetical protein